MCGSVCNPRFLASSVSRSRSLPKSMAAVVTCDPRSKPSRVIAVGHPPPTPPTTLSAGVRASVRKTSLNEACPAALTIGRTTTPGWSIGTRSSERPLCLGTSESVRARTKIQFAHAPADVQIFCPLTTHCPRSSAALVRTDARSEPASGSEKPWHQRSVPDRMRGRKCLFGSSDPKAISVLPSSSIPNWSFSAGSGAPARANSSASTTCSMTERPAPPYSFGQETATKPQSARMRRHRCANAARSSGGSAPAPGQAAGRCSARNERMRVRNALASGGYSMSIASRPPFGRGQDVRRDAPILESVLDRAVRQRSAGYLAPVRVIELMDLEARVERHRESHRVDGLVDRFLDKERCQRRQPGDAAGELYGAVR